MTATLKSPKGTRPSASACVHCGMPLTRKELAGARCPGCWKKLPSRPAVTSRKDEAGAPIFEDLEQPKSPIFEDAVVAPEPRRAPPARSGSGGRILARMIGIAVFLAVKFAIIAACS